MGRNARATFSSNYLPFPLPLTVPSAGVSEGKLWSVCFSDAWLPYVLGALKSLARPETWQGSDSDIQLAVQDAMTLLGEVREFCGVDLIGTIITYATATPPAGTLACDGTTHNRIDYPRLYDALDSAFLIPPDQFTVPDLRSRGVLGSGQGSGLSNRVFASAGGEEQHTLSIDELARHSHTVTGASPAVIVNGENVPVVVATASAGATGDEGLSAAHNNMQPWYALGFAIIAE